MGREIFFRNIRFSYEDKTIFNNFNLCIPMDKNIALVGENGAGKSTLIKLLLSIYKPQKGEIIIGSKPLDQFAEEEKRKVFAVAYQDFYRYPLTLKENLLMYRKSEPHKKEIFRVLSALGMEDYINYLDRKLGKYGEGSLELSDGQWQKIAIGRALLANSDVLVLDEPTAAMDPVSESNLYENFMNIMRLKSTIIVTHRMALAKYADLIIALRNGEVAGMGTHEELMESNPYYFTLYNEQRLWYQ